MASAQSMREGLRSLDDTVLMPHGIKIQYKAWVFSVKSAAGA